MKKTLFVFIIMYLSFGAEKTDAQQQEMYTFCTGSSYAYLFDTTSTTSSSYFARWNIGQTPYTAHFQNDTIYQGYGQGSGTGGYGSVKKWAITSPTTATCVWTYTASKMHHDLCPMPNGNVLVLVRETKTLSQVQAIGGNVSSGTTYSFDIIREIKPTGATSGTVVWEWKLWDHLCQSKGSSYPNYYSNVANCPQRWNINCNLTTDGFHPNGLDYNPTLDQIVFSSHNHDEIFVIDHSTTTAEAATSAGGNSGKGGDFLYRWGKPQNYNCTANGNGVTLNVIHDVRWVLTTNTLYPGYISFFHNGGCSSGHAAVLCLPPYNGYNYTYTAGSVIGPTSGVTPTTPAFTVQNMGGCQALENGNILVMNPNARFYECNGAGTTYQNVQVMSVQADRLKKCEVRYPVVTATTSDNSICVNTPFSLGSSATSIMETNPTHSYSWTSDIGGFSSSSQNPTVTPTTAGNYTYTVTVTNNAGCTATASVSITVNACTGTEESEMKNAGLQFFPNPTTGMINLNEAFTLDNDFEVSIYNSFGELIIQKNNVTHIDLSPYAIGIYYIIVKTSDKELIRKKVVLIK
ncbi:MAG TPA: aryl-sulfate sulfotransferase [Bacteroidales bacterium]|nr:aryl-sulfate sulfotransferase [Bacteroidales bacterium]